jgi:hypothetical protein
MATLSIAERPMLAKEASTWSMLAFAGRRKASATWVLACLESFRPVRMGMSGPPAYTQRVWRGVRGFCFFAKNLLHWVDQADYT